MKRKIRMKVLWFVPVRNYYSQYSHDYNGGGWITSLENIISKRDEVELSIAFYDTIGQHDKIRNCTTTYYPMPSQKQSTIAKIWQSFRPLNIQAEQKILDTQKVAKKVIEDYKPDIIQIFGTESALGIVSEITDTPCVIHLQGILSACMNAWLPPFFSWREYFHQSFHPRRLKYILGEKLSWNRNVLIENQIFKKCQNFIGRTAWDKRVTAILNPYAAYYHCDEILRESFYKTDERKLPEKPIFVSTISYMLYKGYDLILKTAKILKEYTDLPFEWLVYGNVNPEFVEKKLGIRHANVNVRLMGVASPEKLKEELLNATAYVHPSYIENSSNAIGEAQILGLTTVCCHVGGLSTLVENDKTGFLVPTNHPYELAYILKHIFENPELNTRIGTAAQIEALERHNPQRICDALIGIYKKIIASHHDSKE